MFDGKTVERILQISSWIFQNFLVSCSHWKTKSLLKICLFCEISHIKVFLWIRLNFTFLQFVFSNSPQLFLFQHLSENSEKLCGFANFSLQNSAEFHLTRNLDFLVRSKWTKMCKWKGTIQLSIFVDKTSKFLFFCALLSRIRGRIVTQFHLFTVRFLIFYEFSTIFSVSTNFRKIWILCCWHFFASEYCWISSHRRSLKTDQIEMNQNMEMERKIWTFCFRCWNLQISLFWRATFEN